MDRAILSSLKLGVDFSSLTFSPHNDSFESLCGVLFYPGYNKPGLLYRRKYHMNETFMKEKPILPLLTSMALPMVISMMVNALYNIVDSLFVARINENAMTALSLVFPIKNFVNALAIGFGVGINALIAYFLGAGDKRRRPRRHTGTCSGTHPRRCRHCVKHLHHAGFP